MQAKNNILRIALILFLSLLTPPAIEAQSSRDAVRKLINNLRCSDFEWISYAGGPKKYVLAVPLTIDGRNYKYQLDTGSPHTFIYGNEAERWGWAKGQKSVGVRNLKAAGLNLSGAKLHVKEETRPGKTDGTLGLDLLLGQIVVLDYPGQRFCSIRAESAPVELVSRTNWVSAEILLGKLFIKAKINGEELDHVFFDTGASLFPLAVDFEKWKTLTGHADEAGATTKIIVSSWGKLKPMVGAPATGTLEVGLIRISRPTVYYWGDEPTFFKKWFHPATGLIGNAPFWDEVVVLNLGTRPAFGILR